MNKKQDAARRSKLQEVLTLIAQANAFDKRELQSQCQEAKPQFVTNVLKQLVQEGVLAETNGSPLSGSQTKCFAWNTAREQFVIDAWIDKQFVGTQVTSAPLEERPRERLLDQGAHNLKTSELFAILIRSGIRGESAVQAGQKLTNHFNTCMERLPKMSRGELKAISNAVSEVAYCQIQAGIELGRRVNEAVLRNEPKPKINSTRAAMEYCQNQFVRLSQDALQEEFHIVTLDTKLQPIQNHRITVGTLDASLVHPREVFRPAIRDAASAVLLIHNHPSGDPTPSRQDIEVTNRMRESGKLLGIQVIDHIVVARDRAVSLAEWDG